MKNVITGRQSFLSRAFVSGVAGIALSIGLVSVAAASPGHGKAKQPAIGQVGDSAQVTRTVEVDLEDNYFTPESISVLKNQTVRFLVKNTGDFVHEFNIGTAAMHAAHQDEMMKMVDHGILEVDKINREMMTMDMGNGKTMAHDDPNSVLLEPGESAEIVWSFPEAAELEFACNVPGHYDSGMMGYLMIEDKTQDTAQVPNP